MHRHFFTERLQQAGSRIATSTSDAHILLDKNEQFDDVDYFTKKQVTDALLAADWNRYPTADCSDIEAMVANYCQLNPENIVLGPGSGNIITTLLNYFAINRKRIVITQPTYMLFEYHCKTYNIPYESWNLTADLEYDYANMPALGAGSVLIVTAPNNPVGNLFDLNMLEQILTDNPESIVLLDAVYAEFAGMDLAPLVRKYSNLMVLRSFSKAFPMAGVRLGYLCAAPEVAALVRKLMLQFSLNHFTQVFAREVLFTPAFMECSRQRVKALISERERMYRWFNRQFDDAVLKVYKSAGNFLLVRVHDDAAFGKLMANFQQNGIKVLNSSAFPMLQNTFRVSVGSMEENDQVIRCVAESLGQHKMAPVVPMVEYYPTGKYANLGLVAN